MPTPKSVERSRRIERDAEKPDDGSRLWRLTEGTAEQVALSKSDEAAFCYCINLYRFLSQSSGEVQVLYRRQETLSSPSTLAGAASKRHGSLLSQTRHKIGPSQK